MPASSDDQEAWAMPYPSWARLHDQCIREADARAARIEALWEEAKEERNVALLEAKELTRQLRQVTGDYNALATRMRSIELTLRQFPFDLMGMAEIQVEMALRGVRRLLQRQAELQAEIERLQRVENVPLRKRRRLIENS